MNTHRRSTLRAALAATVLSLALPWSAEPPGTDCRSLAEQAVRLVVPSRRAARPT